MGMRMRWWPTICRSKQSPENDQERWRRHPASTHERRVQLWRGDFHARADADRGHGLPLQPVPEAVGALLRQRQPAEVGRAGGGGRTHHLVPFVGEVRRGFCSRCGSWLFWEPLLRDWTSVALGSLDGPTGLALERHIFVAHKGDYYTIGDGLPQNEH